MKIVKKNITIQELKTMAQKMFGNLVKAVVDIEKEIMAIDGELHADEEALLIKSGSDNKDLWGINIYTDLSPENWIEFDSMINLKPALSNRTRSVEDKSKQEKIIQIVEKLIKK
ncbi:hypothetical protein D4R86_05560 [bacterium]|nr:MAG: hypothetical protein D4R86_05560 [bacterium]